MSNAVRESYADSPNPYATRKVMTYDSYGRLHPLGEAYRPAPKVIPARPVEPSEEERRQYLSDTHCRLWIRDGLFAESLDQALSIIEHFGGRQTMPITRDVIASTPPSAGGHGVALIALGEAALLKNADRFLDSVLTDIKHAIATKGSYYGAWDYDGIGAFQKATIRIIPANEGYIVRISQPRSNPERAIATQAGIHHRLLRAEHLVTWATSGSDYRIPLSQLTLLANLLDMTPANDARGIYEAFATPEGDSDFGPATITENDTIRIVAHIDETRIPSNWNLRQIAHSEGLVDVPSEWAHRFVDNERDPAMVGRARTWGEWDNPWASGIRIYIEPRNPLDPEHEAAAIAASNQINRLWAGLPGAWRDSQ